MRKKSKIMRVDEGFYNWSQVMKKELESAGQRKMNTTDFTASLARFHKQEGIDKIMKRQVRRGYGGWL